MRITVVLSVSTLLLAGCKREAQEAAAQAKGAAADAQRAAKDAAAKARGAADQAADAARSAADQARVAASNAGDSARQGMEGAGQSLREITAGDQVEGVLLSTGAAEVSVRPRSGSVQTMHTDDRTRWIFHGPAKEGFAAGAPVRVTYIVRSGQRVATQVEALAH